MWAGDHDLWHSNYVSACINELETDTGIGNAYSRTLLIDIKENPIKIMNDQIDTRGLKPLDRFRKIIWELGYCNMFLGYFELVF